MNRFIFLELHIPRSVVPQNCRKLPDVYDKIQPALGQQRHPRYLTLCLSVATPLYNFAWNFKHFSSVLLLYLLFKCSKSLVMYYIVWVQRAILGHAACMEITGHLCGSLSTFTWVPGSNLGHLISVATFANFAHLELLDYIKTYLRTKNPIYFAHRLLKVSSLSPDPTKHSACVFLWQKETWPYLWFLNMATLVHIYKKSLR